MMACLPAPGEEVGWGGGAGRELAAGGMGGVVQTTALNKPGG